MTKPEKAGIAIDACLSAYLGSIVGFVGGDNRTSPRAMHVQLTILEFLLNDEIGLFALLFLHLCHP